MADTTGNGGYRPLRPYGDSAVELASCRACGAAVAVDDPAAVDQHNRWHRSHPGPPAVGDETFTDRVPKT